MASTTTTPSTPVGVRPGPGMTPASTMNTPSASSVKIYNAVYSSVQVFECMIRGIAVMRRRIDSFVNATQILKVAGVDKGRRTKILEKEILPGKHEIVQGGYGKYQGTWIPLERGRELAIQYGVAPLLAPLFDFIPTAQATQLLPPNLAPSRNSTPSRHGPGSPFPFQYNPAIHSTPFPPSPTPIVPGSALKLLNQGRAQGFFTPSTSLMHSATWSPGGTHMLGPPAPLRPPGGMSAPSSPAPSSRKRAREASSTHKSLNGSAPDVLMPDSTETTPQARPQSGGPPPPKKARTESDLQSSLLPPAQLTSNTREQTLAGPATANGRSVPSPVYDPLPRFATKSSAHRTADRGTVWRNPKRVAVLATIQTSSSTVESILKTLEAANPRIDNSPDYDLILDDQGHTPLHLAAALARSDVIDGLIKRGVDVRRGSFTGETALIRAALSTHAYESQTFNKIVAQLHESIRTLDNSRRTVLHHIAHLAGVKGRAPAARYYLECVLMWIAQREHGDFKSIINLQDEHGDTALNIAARVGNRSIVKTLVDVGANRLLPNKLGLRPGDFGVEEELLAPGASDVMASLQGPSGVPAQKSKEVISDITSIVNGLSGDFEAEVKDKQSALEQAQRRLQVSTRQLAEQRRQIQIWQARCNELEQTQQRIRNLQRALAEEDKFDWTGRTEWDGSPATFETAGLAFEHKGVDSTLASLSSSNEDIGLLEADPPVPLSDSPSSLIRLRRLELWHRRANKLLSDRLNVINGASAEKELRCKKIISMATGLSPEQVEQMSGSLLTAMESEPQLGDLGRIANFMQRVRNSEVETATWNLSH